MIKIVVDTFGADSGEQTVIRGIARALRSGLEFYPLLVGDEKTIRKCMQQEGIKESDYDVLHCEKYLTNNDLPTVIFTESDSSMAMSYDRLKKDEGYSALLSAGNTGALLVGSICRLGLVSGLKFPALLSALPTGSSDGLLCLVDCGANLECTPNDLVNFAVMGSVFAKTYCQLENPRVGLMSVGREKGKGNALTKQTFDLLEKLPINFVGNLEGSDMVTGYADVIVCDGFSGNLLLKCAEAVGRAAMNIVERVGKERDSELVDAINKELFSTFDFNSQGAATFLGTKKTVVKMHGAANEDTVVASVAQLLRLEKAEFSKAIAEAMKK